MNSVFDIYVRIIFLGPNGAFMKSICSYQWLGSGSKGSRKAFTLTYL